MILEDGSPGIVDPAARERLAKRVCGIHSAYRSMEREDDRRQPPNAGKQGRSKVGEELGRRLDLAKANIDEPALVNLEVEEEIFAEAERGASLLKFFATLRVRQSAGAEQG